MISAELRYNPYRLETFVTFNGYDPCINSKFEKFSKKPLHDWIQLAPALFFDEMNGFDFDLYFSGTSLDFETVKKVFSGTTVKVHFRNELECHKLKRDRIDALIAWLQENRNNRFDFDKFQRDNSELFSTTASLIVLPGEYTELMDGFVNIEPIHTVDEIAETNLESTPILFVVNEITQSTFRRDLESLLKRSDVKSPQLFFSIADTLNVEQIVRVITDLGVDDPQVVRDESDSLIRDYVSNYPESLFIRDVLSCLDEYSSSIKRSLDEDCRRCELSGADVRAKMRILDDNVARLKTAQDFFGRLDNFQEPFEFTSYRQSLASKAYEWRTRKTKIIGSEDARKAAEDYSNYLRSLADGFHDRVSDSYKAASEKIRDDFYEKYSAAGLNLEFRPRGINLEDMQALEMPDLIEQLLGSYEITDSDSKNDLLGRLIGGAKEDPTSTQTVAYFVEDWRKKAIQTMLHSATKLAAACSESLARYYSSLASEYSSHIANLIEQQELNKEELALQMSDDERLLKIDLDWHSSFNDQIESIKWD